MGLKEYIRYKYKVWVNRILSSLVVVKIVEGECTFQMHFAYVAGTDE